LFLNDSYVVPDDLFGFRAFFTICAVFFLVFVAEEHVNLVENVNFIAFKNLVPHF